MTDAERVEQWVELLSERFARFVKEAIDEAQAAGANVLSALQDTASDLCDDEEVCDPFRGPVIDRLVAPHQLAALA